MCLPPDRPGGVLPGALPGCQLQGLRQEPVCVLSVQGAWLLPVWLLCRPVTDQHGQAKCGPAATTLPVCVWRHLCITQLHAGHLHCNSELQTTYPSPGGGQVCVCVCVCNLLTCVFCSV